MISPAKAGNASKSIARNAGSTVMAHGKLAGEDDSGLHWALAKRLGVEDGDAPDD